MAADTGILSAYGKLADAQQKDWSGVLQSQKEGYNIITKGVEGFAKQQQQYFKDKAQIYKEENERKRLDNQKFDTEFDKRTTVISKEINEGGGLPDHISDVVKENIKGIGDEYKSYNALPGGKQSIDDKDNQNKAFNQVSLVEKQIVGMRTMFGTDVKASPAMSGEAKKRHLQVYQGGDNVVTSMNSDRQFQFEITTPAVINEISLQEITPSSSQAYTYEQLEEEFIPQAVDAEAFIMGSGTDFANLAISQQHGQVTEDMIRKEAYKISSKLEDPKALADIAQRDMGMEDPTPLKNDTGKWTAGSIAYSLQNHPSLNLSVYQNAGIEVPDLDGDPNIVSQAEADAVMLDETNRDIIISTLVDPYYINPNTNENHYNHAISSEVIGMHVALNHKNLYLAKHAAKWGSDKNLMKVEE